MNYDWHVLILRDVPEGDDVDEKGRERVTLLHPEDCEVTISSRTGSQYHCGVGYELSEGGREILDHLPAGAHFVRGEVVSIPCGQFFTERDWEWDIQTAEGFNEV